MELYVIRHGIAVDRSASIKEFDRYLTEEGRVKMNLIGAGLKKLGVNFDLIITSPLVRARQTAEIVAEQTGYSIDNIKETDDLKVGNNWENVFDMVDNQEHVAIVGHDPMFSEIVSTLLFGEDTDNTPMKKGGVCRISMMSKKSKQGELKWFIPPKIFVELAK